MNGKSQHDKMETRTCIVCQACKPVNAFPADYVSVVCNACREKNAVSAEMVEYGSDDRGSETDRRSENSLDYQGYLTYRYRNVQEISKQKNTKVSKPSKRVTRQPSPAVKRKTTERKTHVVDDHTKLDALTQVKKHMAWEPKQQRKTPRIEQSNKMRAAGMFASATAAAVAKKHSMTEVEQRQAVQRQAFERQSMFGLQQDREKAFREKKDQEKFWWAPQGDVFVEPEPSYSGGMMPMGPMGILSLLVGVFR